MPHTLHLPPPSASAEFSTVETANIALALNGLQLLTASLKISRPNNYQPSVGLGGLEGPLAALAPSVVPAAAGISAISDPEAAKALVDAAQTAQTGAAVQRDAASCCVSCSNMLTAEELLDAAERRALKEDVAEECEKFGPLDDMKIPTSNNAACNIYIRWGTREAAAIALRALSGRKFDGRVVAVEPIGDDAFEALLDGK